MILWLWFLGGVGLGVLLVLSLKRSVAHLKPEESSIALPRVIMSYFARHLVLAVALVLAIRHDGLAGVVMVAGFWIGRWAMILFGLKE